MTRSRKRLVPLAGAVAIAAVVIWRLGGVGSDSPTAGAAPFDRPTHVRGSTPRGAAAATLSGTIHLRWAWANHALPPLPVGGRIRYAVAGELGRAECAYEGTTTIEADGTPIADALVATEINLIATAHGFIEDAVWSVEPIVTTSSNGDVRIPLRASTAPELLVSKAGYHRAHVARLGPAADGVISLYRVD